MKLEENGYNAGGDSSSEQIVLYLSNRTRAIKTPIVPIKRPTLGNSKLSKNDVFLFISLTNESMGS